MSTVADEALPDDMMNIMNDLQNVNGLTDNETRDLLTKISETKIWHHFQDMEEDLQAILSKYAKRVPNHGSMLKMSLFIITGVLFQAKRPDVPYDKVEHDLIDIIQRSRRIYEGLMNERETNKTPEEGIPETIQE